MDDRPERIVRGLIPGQKIAVYPLSTRYGDILTAYGKGAIPLNPLRYPWMNRFRRNS